MASGVCINTISSWTQYGWTWGDERLSEEAKRLRDIDVACRQRNPLPRKDVLAVIRDDGRMGRADASKSPFAFHLIVNQTIGR